VLFLKRVGDVFQEDEAEDDVLVFCRVEIPAQFVSCCPKRGLKTKSGAAG
jgi:hypothetical protein